MRKEVNRRVFLERLGACALGGAALSQGIGRRASAQSSGYPSDPASGPTGANQASWTKPQVLNNPNILIILVDQMRWPCWLSASQMTTLDTIMLPNIFGKLRDKSYVFQQYYTAATVCTASRGTLLTGLYAPQTAVYLGADTIDGSVPNLNPAFPTFSTALQSLNTAYKGNFWWFGKWHLSTCNNSTPLTSYGFKTGLYPGGPMPGGPSWNPDPTGVSNEGTDGGPFTGEGTWANDQMIAQDFASWLAGNATYGSAGSPWCATVSLINPHDIASAPISLQCPYAGSANGPWFQPPTWFTTNTGVIPNDVNSPPNGWPMLYTPDNSPNQTLPIPWNWENLPKLGGEGSGPWPETGGIKPDAQLAFQRSQNSAFGPVTDWTLFLNQYYWLQQYVDGQVGAVLNALQNSGMASNTIIIFAADHGEYAGSHGLHDKGYAAYDESIHVPLYIQFPGQSSCIPMNQMCSSVDFLRLICDLGTGGGTSTSGGQFLTQYPDQANRQQIWNFLYTNGPETRVAPSLAVGAQPQPYVFHTCDVADDAPQTTKVHVCALRGKSSGPQPAKMVMYFEWAQCTTYPDGLSQDYEFYDYSVTNNNTKELGNNYNGNGVTGTGTPNLSLQTAYLNAMGNWAGWTSPTPQPQGLIATELNAPLLGAGLSQAQAAAQTAYLNYMFGTGVCPVGST